MFSPAQLIPGRSQLNIPVISRSPDDNTIEKLTSAHVRIFKSYCWLRYCTYMYVTCCYLAPKELLVWIAYEVRLVALELLIGLACSSGTAGAVGFGLRVTSPTTHLARLELLGLAYV